MNSFPTNTMSASKFRQTISSFLKNKQKEKEDTLNQDISLNQKETPLASTMGYKKYFVGSQDYETSCNYFLTGDVSEGDTFTLYA